MRVIASGALALLICVSVVPGLPAAQDSETYAEEYDLYKKADKSEEDIQTILRFMEKSGGLDYTKQRAKDFSSFAKATLADLPDTAAKRLLGILCEHASTRKN